MENEPLSNDSDESVSFQSLQKEIFVATHSNPEQIVMNANSTGDFVYFSENARFMTSAFQTIGFRTYQTLEKLEDTLTLENNQIVPIYAFKFLQSSYKADESGTPTPDTQKELACRYARTPYSTWLESCDLPPFQDYYVYFLQNQNNFPFFYNFKKRNLTMQLPTAMIQGNRCLGLPNCTAQVTEIEFDLITTKDGERNRQHILLWLTRDLPYLASNPKYCINTLVEVDQQRYPYEYCRELVNFIPGN